MAINSNHLRHHVIRPALKFINTWSYPAEELLLGTAAQESRMGTYLKQLNGGPAIGIFQMELFTYNDLWASFIKYKPEEFRDRLKMLATRTNSADARPSGYDMVGNLYYAAAMARVFYMRIPEALPSESDVVAMAEYWKKYYNTVHGKGTVSEFVHNYQSFV